MCRFDKNKAVVQQKIKTIKTGYIQIVVFDT
jgi:hypothetical protein